MGLEPTPTNNVPPYTTQPKRHVLFDAPPPTVMGWIESVMSTNVSIETLIQILIDINVLIEMLIQICDEYQCINRNVDRN